MLNIYIFGKTYSLILEKEKECKKPMNELNQIMAISSITHFCVLFIFSKLNHVLPFTLVLPTKYRSSYGPISY